MAKTLRGVVIDIAKILSDPTLPEKDKMWWTVISCRGVEHACPECQGLGMLTYGDTATWHGGVGGQTLTTDVCYHCWGSGDAYRKGADLRAMLGRIYQLEMELKKERT